MASDAVPPPAPRWSLRSLSLPWILELAALGIVVAGLLAGLGSAPAKAIFLAAGLILAGYGVSRRLQGGPAAEWEERVASASLVAFAAFIALVAYLGADASWSSTRLFLKVLTGVAVGGAGLVLLSPLGRRIAVSVLVLFHFTSILTAVTSVPTMPQGMIPWVPAQLQVRVFHDYQEFTYLTNAYHFYSPDPGPPTLLRFRVRYTDGTARWIKTPVREDHSMGLNYQRMLALTENVAHPGPILSRWQLEPRYRLIDEDKKTLRAEGVPEDVVQRLKPMMERMFITAEESPDMPLQDPDPEARSARGQFVKELSRFLSGAEMEQYGEAILRAARLKTWEESTGEKYPHPSSEEAARRRWLAAQGKKLYGGMPIPFAFFNSMPIQQQYSPPGNDTLTVVASYARHVAHNAPHPTNPDARVKSVKIYRITHQLIDPAQLAAGIDPRHQAFYLPYYMGEYSPEGKLLDADDPCLYWLLPIGFTFQPVKPNEPAAQQVQINNPVVPENAFWINCMKIHAGDSTPDPEAKPAESIKP